MPLFAGNHSYGKFCAVDIAGEFPLSEQQVKMVREKRIQFARYCTCGELFISYLIRYICITDRQKNALQDVKDETRRNDLLIDIMILRSVRDLNKMLACFRETEQPFLEALWTDKGGFTPAFHKHCQRSLFLSNCQSLSYINLRQLYV